MVDFHKMLRDRNNPPSPNRPAPKPPAVDPTETHYADEYEWEEEERDDNRRQEAGDDDPLGCCFPDKCCMPGDHHRSECHTAEMMEQFHKEQDRPRKESPQ